MKVLQKVLNCEVPIMQAPMAGVSIPELVSSVSNNGGIGSHGCARLSPDKIVNDIKTIKTQLNNNNSFYNINLFAPQPRHLLSESMQTEIETYENNSISNENLNKIVTILNKFHKKLNIDLINIEDTNDFDTKYLKEKFTFLDQFNAIINEGVPIFSFTFGTINNEQSNILKKLGIIRIGTATNTIEAEYLIDNKLIDILIIQGSEAGAHRGTFLTNNFKNSMIPLMSLIPSINYKINWFVLYFWYYTDLIVN